MAAPRPLRVVLCDDADDFRALVRAWLTVDDRIEIVGEAADGAEGVAAVVEHHPDVLLLDLSMPRVDGLTALAQLRDVAPATAVVACSSHPAQEMAQRVLEHGAIAYVEKAAAPHELRAAVLSAGGLVA